MSDEQGQVFECRPVVEPGRWAVVACWVCPPTGHQVDEVIATTEWHRGRVTERPYTGAVLELLTRVRERWPAARPGHKERELPASVRLAMALRT